MPFDAATDEDVTDLTAAFNEIRDADITDDERLRRGRGICMELYVKCGGKEDRE